MREEMGADRESETFGLGGVEDGIGTIYAG